VNGFHLLLANDFQRLQDEFQHLNQTIQRERIDRSGQVKLLNQTIQDERIVSEQRSGEVEHLKQKFENTLAIYKQCNESKVGLQFYLSFFDSLCFGTGT
jgi:hypothetical protein